MISQKLGEEWRNDDGTTDCYTCDRVIPVGGKVDRGHFLPKRLYKAHYFNLDTIRAQCFRCNAPGQGEQLAFHKGLVEELGAGRVNHILATKDDTWSEDKQWYIDFIREVQDESSN